jgi:hypothetical protein
MKRLFTWFMFGAAGFPLLYLLAGGPIIFVYERGWVSLHTVTTIGAPINWAGDCGLLRRSGIEKPLLSYYSWWSSCAH